MKKSPELIEDLRLMGSQELHVVLHYLADNATEARLLNGARLCDVGDFQDWLRELAAAAQVRHQAPAAECPLCFHVHESETQCNFYIGGSRHCLCDHRMPAGA